MAHEYQKSGCVRLIVFYILIQIYKTAPQHSVLFPAWVISECCKQLKHGETIIYILAASAYVF